MGDYGIQRKITTDEVCTTFEGMSIYNELQELNAPSKVLQAGQEIDKHVQAGIPPSREFVAYVRDWVTRNQGNNRYGK